MKKILSILICVVLGVINVWARESLKIQAQLYVYQDAGGEVVATKDQTPPNSGWVTSFTNEVTVNDNPTSKSNGFMQGDTYTWTNYSLYYHARVTSGNVFIGWSNNNDNIVDDIQFATTLNLSQTGTWTHSSGFMGLSGSDFTIKSPAATKYAIFRPIIETLYGEKITLFYDPITGEVADGEWQVKINRSTSLNVESLNSAFTISNSTPISLTGATDEIVTIKITAVDGTEAGLYENAIQITPSNTSLNATQYNPAALQIDVELVPSPVVTFVPATQGGTYTYQQVSVTPIPQPVPVNEDKQIGILKSTDGVIKLVASPAAGYRVYRWVITDDSGTKYDYLSGNTKMDSETNFTKDATVTVEFTEDKYALFFVKEAPTIKYNDLNDAIAAAGSYTSKTVVVDPMQNATANCKGGYLRADDYTIPDGYTLLVPGDADYTTIGDKTAPPESIWVTDSEMAMSNFCKLIVESGTTINVEGVLCVYAKWNYASTTSSRQKPGMYGWIEMEDDVEININDATLHALGYITNVQGTTITNDNINQVGRVYANAGAEVYEIFVMTDWRGGSAITGSTESIAQAINLGIIANGGAAGMVKNSSKVFPMSQYYIQCIEAPITFTYGAKEKVQTMVAISSFRPYCTIDFIVPNDTENLSESLIESGLVRLGDNTKLTKYYDVNTDRLKMILEPIDQSNQDQIPTLFSSLKMELTAGATKVPVNSQDYTLPINNNIDITVKVGVDVYVPEGCDMCFLAGSSVTVEEDATVNIDANVYIYDAAEKSFHDITTNTTVNGLGYFGSGNKIILPIPKRPGTLVTRSIGDIEDAKWHIDGTVNVNAGFYTTDGGANITSNGGGEVVYNAKVTKDTTAQAYQSGIAYYYQIPITIAKLYNADESFSAGDVIQAGQRYIYYDDLDGGKWSLPRAAIANVTLPTFAITLPTQSSPTGKIICTVNKPDGVRDYLTTDFDIQNSNTTLFTVGSWTFEGDKLIIPITFNKQDKHSDDDITTVLTVKSSTSAAVNLTPREITVTATEKYTPQFSASVTTLSTTVNNPVSTGVSFTLVENNVTTIWNDATYGSRLQWSVGGISGANALEFTFAYGEGEQMLSGAQVTFNPTSEGTKEATLTLIAAYTDAGGHIEQTPVDIPLSGNATLNANTLAFALPFPDPIYEDSEAFLLFEDGSRNNNKNISITTSHSGIVEITGDGTAENPYKVQPLSDGVVEISVSQSASTSVKGIEEGTMKITIQVQPKQVELYPLDLCVDSQDKFSAHTLAAQLVRFDNNAIVFTSNESQTAIWEMQFEGVPQHVKFELSGTNNWLVQQGDKEGENWKNLPISATGTFDGLLLPTTRRLKFTYAMGVSEGRLTNLCIYALDLTASAEKVYLPINVDDSESSVEFQFIHTTDLTFNDISSNLTISTTTNNTGTSEEPYLTTTVTVSPKNNTVVDTEYTLTANDGSNTKSVVIRTYRYPQLLPINLATDEQERFYFVNYAPKTAYTTWDATNRKVVFQNPNQIALRYATFVFEGAPYSISFDMDEGINLADLKISESTDGLIFTEISTPAIVEGQSYKQDLDYHSKYVYIENRSTNMSELGLSNLIITGKPEVHANPDELVFNKELTELPLVLTAVNLDEVRIELSDPVNFAFKQQGDDTEITSLALTKDSYNGLGYNKYCDIPLSVVWKALNAVDDAKMIIYDDQADTIMAEIRLLGAGEFITQENAEQSGLYSGIPNDYTYHGRSYEGYEYRQLNLLNTFAEDGTAIFDYLFIYGPTTPESGNDITAPGTGGELRGSNAVTPFYIYKKSEPNAEGKCIGYQFVTMISNTNVSEKTGVEDIIIKDSTTYINVQDSLRIYMTGFAPYATTGYTKNDEGVFFFRGKHGTKLDIYLEDCHIFSRNKTENGNGFYGDKEGGQTFSEGYARGSGGVLVFENTDSKEQLNIVNPFEVNIHTIGDNLLKSNYGCFFILLESMKAYQISAPIHVHLHSAKHVRTTKTTLNFDDKWPTAVDANNAITATKRTNGFLALKKQSNNAPSIDLGNPNTVVNFNGGRIELQNAQIVSENYKTTLAISYRSGEYGGDGVGIKLSYGIGTDSVGGTVYFNDGTTTVEPMWVKEGYKQYYLLDSLDGKLWTRNVGTAEKPIYEYHTSCLRTPKNTYIYGGSHCFMRACQHVTSKGGAPKDGSHGKYLGLYTYKLVEKDSVMPSGYNLTKDSVNPDGLAVKLNFPNHLTNPSLKDYYDSRSYTYGLNSVAPDANNQLNFWIPDGYGGVTAEQDKYMSIWKACMTEIRAGLAGVLEGGIGGDTPIEPNEEVKYFLYCQLDQNIHDVISAGTGTGDDKEYSYKAPVAVPPVASSYFDNAKYTYIGPTHVSDSVQYQVLSDTTYTITDKVYYVTTATADIWQTFTAPFDVKNIWVVETYPEEKLMEVGDGKRDTILISQAHHNADFAAFFAVAMAIGTTDSFEEIYDSYIKWAKGKDQELGFYNGTDDYTLRGKQILEPYYGGNWRTANFYLNHNSANWQLEDGQFKTQWNVITQSEFESGTLLHKGETYSMLFPYLTLNGENLNNRDEWDYWSGKLLIFESTDAPQTINGRDFLNESKAGHIFSTTPASNEIIVTGNSTFARMETMKSNAYIYSSGYPTIGNESFYPNTEENEDGDFVPVSTPTTIWPTTAFLYGEVPANAQGMPARRIMRTGEIIYDQNPDEDDNDNTQTGIPTVGGGNDLYITSIAGGINIAVAAPQHVRVISSTGALFFQGEVQTSVDVALPTAGVYVIAGETEAHKILY